MGFGRSNVVAEAPASKTRESSPHWIVVGNPDSSRVCGFSRVLKQTSDLDCTVLSYADFLYKPQQIQAGLLQQLQNAARFYRACSNRKIDTLLVRIEAPGESTELLNALISRGTKQSMMSQRPGDVPVCDHGEFNGLDYWFAGYKQLLRQIANLIKQVGKSTGLPVNFMNSVSDILAMLDKYKCQQGLRQAGIRVPRLLGLVTDSSHLFSIMRGHACYRVFGKPRYGSSASGLFALEMHPSRTRFKMTTTVELENNGGQYRLFNSLKIKTYTDEPTIRKIVDRLCEDDFYIEQWIPKPRFNDHTYDLRAVLVAQKQCQYIVRTSRSPMTNMHLGNAKQTIDAVSLSSKQRAALDETMINVAKCFPEAGYMGVDVIIPSGSSRPVVLEVNAFGDHVNGFSNTGDRIYREEIVSMQAARCNSSASSKDL